MEPKEGMGKSPKRKEERFGKEETLLFIFAARMALQSENSSDRIGKQAVFLRRAPVVGGIICAVGAAAG